MDKVVVDSSVAIKWLLVENHSVEARKVLADFQTGQIELLAPDFIFAEVANILWKRHVFQAMPLQDAEDMTKVALAFPFSTTESAVLINDAFQIAVRQKRSVYDALYLALSVRENCRFVTADEKLVNAVQGAYPNTILVANWS